MRATVVTVSDRASRGEYADISGPACRGMLVEAGFDVGEVVVIPDGIDSVETTLRDLIGETDLIVTTGGTGFSPRDLTPEATRLVVDREAPGFVEAMRASTLGKNVFGMLSRAVSGIAGRTLIVNVPGSEKGATESLDVIMGALKHGVELLIDHPTDHNT
ncbi:molybdopterin adenylyltransferase [bacterium BMS3Bbin02]|nr:molybdopterin adenylyltransferase [bacterium BMS3Bbin02]